MISIILLILGGIFNSVMDVIYFKWDKSIFKNIKNVNLYNWCNPTYSWKNKWKDRDPSKGEKFPGSSTIFVFITDLWHFAKFLMLWCISLAIVFYTPITPYLILDIIILHVSFTFIFELFLSKIWIKK